MVERGVILDLELPVQLFEANLQYKYKTKKAR
jgi:hypothetical protein